MIRLSQLIPLNYQEEKAKFFSNNQYNPQFVYADVIDPKILMYYGETNEALVEKAERLLIEYLPYQKIKLTEKQLNSYLTQAEIQQTTENYLNRQGITNRYQIVWINDAIARCSIKSHQILFRTGADYTELTLNGVLNHEIGTHALRRINDEKQPWHKHKLSLGFENSLQTEEGLATIQQHLDDELPVLYGSALKYFAVSLAQSESFVQTWSELEKYYLDKEKIWNTVFRVKRGLSDTSKAGGFTKDKVYFEGAYAVATWLSEHEYIVDDLYLGRISLNDIEQAKSLKKTTQPILPFFVSDDPAAYKEKLLTLIRENELSK